VLKPSGRNIQIVCQQRCGCGRSDEAERHGGGDGGGELLGLVCYDAHRQFGQAWVQVQSVSGKAFGGYVHPRFNAAISTHVPDRREDA
jgi:hypothetical protein